MYILGLGQIGAHDSSVVLIEDGQIKCIIEEERIKRIKHVGGFPEEALKCLLDIESISLKDIDHIAIVDRPYFRFFQRIFRWYLSKLISYPQNSIYHIFQNELPLILEIERIKRKLKKDSGNIPQIHFVEHHLTHMASAFFVSPFEDAAVISIDGRGEIGTTVLGYGKKNTLKKIKEAFMPYSLGAFYAAITDYLGFKFFGG